MTSNKGPLGLTTPEHRVAPNASSLSTSPKKLEEWIRALPRAHVGETGRLVFAALSQMNRLDIGPEMRYTALELLVEPVDYVVNSSKKHFVGHAFPLSPKAAKVVALVQTMYAELAVGYKIIVEDMLTKTHSIGKNRGFIASVFRALSYLNTVLHFCYITYQPAPRGYWLELHKLYYFAVTVGIHHLGQNDINRPTETVEDQYKQALLMALVNTYQQSQEDITAIQNSLGHWTPYCDLDVLRDPAKPSGIVIISLDVDEPPTYAAFTKEITGQCLILNSERLAQHLTMLISASNTSQTPLSPGLLQRLATAWCSVPKRSYRRRQAGTSAKVILGLSAVHIFLTKIYTRSRPAERDQNDRSLLFRASFSGHSVSSSADGSGAYPDILDFYDGGSSSVSVGDDGSFNRTNSAYNLNSSESKGSDEESFVITNESAGGYCLSGTPTTAGSIKVGDILYMQQKGPSGTYNICVVRWMRRDRERLVLGVEILAPFAEPITLKLTARDATVVTGLLFPPSPVMNQAATLVTSATFRQGQTAQIKQQIGEKEILIDKILQSTRTFRQYLFKETTEQPTVEDEANFDSIWSSL